MLNPLHVFNCRISKVSGEEYKLLSSSLCKFLSFPSLFFLSEPNSVLTILFPDKFNLSGKKLLNETVDERTLIQRKADPDSYEVHVIIFGELYELHNL
jgi:hypothetical protein